MKNTVTTLQKQKMDGDKISMLTCYDYSMARLMDEAGINVLLIGDSLGNVVLGYEDTISVTMEDMIHHTAAVARGAKNAFVLAEGDVLELNKRQGKITGKVQAGGILVDGLGVGDVGNIVLNDRKLLSQNGLIIATVTLQKHGNMILAGPDIVSRGFVYVRESESLMEGARDVARDAVEECLERNITDWARIKTKIKDELSNYIWKKTKRNPMILPIITEV